MSAKEIAESAAANDDPVCADSIEFFSTVLGGASADLGLTFHADGGIFLGGGVLARIRNLLSVDRFNQGYLRNVVKKDYLSQLPVYLLNDSETGLEGSAVYATRIQSHG